MRQRQKQDRELMDKQAELIGTFKEELDFFRTQFNRREQSNLTKQELERQRLLQRQSEQQWRQLRDIGKVVGWMLKQDD